MSMLVAIAFRIGFVTLFLSVGGLLEWIAPIQKVRNSTRIVNVLVGSCYHLADLIGNLAVVYVLSAATGHYARLQMPSDRHGIVLAFGITFLWLAMRDFFYYWFHRWQHSSRWLWVEHAVHHSDEEMNVTTSVRSHWLEMPLVALFVTAPVTLLFSPPLISFPVVWIVTGTVPYLIHCNVRWSIGPLAAVIASPQNHRIHHSRLPEHIDKNFAQFFPLWDMLFGTYYKPRPDEFPETGLSSGQKVESFAQAFAWPFKEWAKMLHARGKSSVSTLEDPPAMARNEA